MREMAGIGHQWARWFCLRERFGGREDLHQQAMAFRDQVAYLVAPPRIASATPHRRS